MQRHKRRWTFVVLAIVAVAVAIVTLLLPRIVDLNRYRGPITARIEQATGGEASLGSISWRVANGLRLQVEDLTLRNAAVLPGDIELPRIDAKVSLLPLLQEEFVVQELRLERPVLAVRLSRQAATQGAVTPPPASMPSEGAPPGGATDGGEKSALPVALSIERIEVEQGQITLEDPISARKERVYRLEELDVAASNLKPGGQMSFQFSLRDADKPGLGALSGRGTFSGFTETFSIVDPRLELTATMKGFDAGIVRPYLSDGSFAQGLGGSISLELDYAGDLGQRFAANGQIDLGQFRYTDPSLWKGPLPGVPTRLAYEIKFGPERIELARLDLALGGISVTGRALIEDWRKRPNITNGVVTGSIPLADLQRFVPKGLFGKDEEIVGQLLSGGGEVVVDRLALPDFEPARLSGDELELVEGIDASLSLSGISFRPSAVWPKFTDIAGKVRLAEGKVSTTDVRGRMGPLTLPVLELHASHLMEKPKLSASAKGPLELIPATDASVEQLLQQHGLSRLTGNAAVDLKASYDWSSPARWDATGTLMLGGIQAETHPEGVRLEDLRGRVSVRRAKGLDISIEHLTARVNQSPIELDGTVDDAGGEAMVLEGRVKVGSLDLAELATLVPVLKAYRVGGKLDMDVQIHYLQADPVNTQASGKLDVHGLALQWKDWAIEQGNTGIALSSQTVDIKEAQLRVNDQALQLSGRLTGLHEPKAQLDLKSANLNVDHLLPPAKAAAVAQPSAPPGEPAPDVSGSTQTDAAAVRNVKRSELPDIARQSTINIMTEFTQGQYREQKFRGLRLQADYDRGMIKDHAFSVGIGGGRLTTRGSIDLRDLEHIPFDVTPGMNAVPLESISRLIDLDQTLLHGPVSVAGSLQGRTGSREELITSLEGNLKAEIGPGRIHRDTHIGDALFDLLSVIHIEGILSGKPRDAFAAEGVPYDALKIETEFKDGSIRVDQVELKSPAFNIAGTGAIDLIRERLSMKADVAVLKTVDEVLGFVPLAGKVAADMTEVQLNVEGPVDNPDVRVRPAGGLVHSIETEAKKVGKRIKGLFKRHPHHDD